MEESREAVAERRRIVRVLVFREYLLDVHSVVCQPPEAVMLRVAIGRRSQL